MALQTFLEVDEQGTDIVYKGFVCSLVCVTSLHVTHSFLSSSYHEAVVLSLDIAWHIHHA